MSNINESYFLWQFQKQKSYKYVSISFSIFNNLEVLLFVHKRSIMFGKLCGDVKQETTNS